MQINQKIATLCGLIGELTANIETEETLKKGEKYLLIQQLELALKPLGKYKEQIKEEFGRVATTQPHNFEGAEIYKKIIYPKASLDADKLESDLIRAYTEIGTKYDQAIYLKEATPRTTVIIQSILGK